VGGEAEAPEEVELAWQAQNPEGEIIHVESDDEGNISSIDENPYGGDDE
jgi:hypothetical protein